MTTTIATARQLLNAHGFRLFAWGGSYTVSRLIPAYGSSAAPFRFHRDHRGFEASNVSLAWVRKLADALALADAGQVTSTACADAWLADRKAEITWQEAGTAQRAASTYDRPDHTLEQVLDLQVAELRAGGASRMAQLVRQVLLEGWQERNPIEPLLARIGSQAPQPAHV